MEDSVEIRTATRNDEIAKAMALDEALPGAHERAGYIASIAGKGGLSIALSCGDVQAFCCLDHGYFFGKPFVSLLIVAPDARRRGLGSGLLSRVAGAYTEVWTSTNQSNSAMRGLLERQGWQYCGELSGLDEDDPELFYRKV